MINKLLNKYILLSFFIAISGFALHANAKGGLKVEQSMELNTNPETVWKMIGDFNHLDVWHPVVVGSSVSGNNNAPGAIRILTLADGANITEKLVAHSTSDKTYTYAITESPLPISDYVSTISISSAANGKSLVTWSSSFNANGVDDSKAQEIITGYLRCRVIKPFKTLF